MPITHDTSQLTILGAALTRQSVTVVGRVTAAVHESGDDLKATAQGLCPVDTGQLRNSIESSTAGLTSTVGPTVDYAKYVEYGTYKMAPQPFMGPATDIVEARFAAALEKAADW